MRLYNVDHQPAVVDPNESATMPGESREFTREEIEAGIGGLWSKDDPRKGLAAERKFKQRRDRARAGQQQASESVDPGKPGESGPGVEAQTDPAEPEN